MLNVIVGPSDWPWLCPWTAQSPLHGPCPHRENSEHSFSQTLAHVTASLAARPFLITDSVPYRLFSIQQVNIRTYVSHSRLSPRMSDRVYQVQDGENAGPSQLLLSYQADADALHDDGWLGATYGSPDNGSTW